MLKQLVPPNLLADENIKALVEAIEPEFEKVKSEIINVLIYPRIDELSEEVLDLLAWQFHIEGYELATNITEKRNLIKKAIELHRYKGTKYAIEQVLKALNLDGKISEWFEYGGQPYRFKVDISLINKPFDKDIYDKLTKLIEQYKNLRSHLDSITVYLTSTPHNYKAITTQTGTDITLYPVIEKQIKSYISSYKAIFTQTVSKATVYPS